VVTFVAVSNKTIACEIIGEKMNIVNVAANNSARRNLLIRVHRDQKGFNVLGFLAFVAVVVVLALLFIPNVNLFLGIDKKINAANVEALNVRAAVIAYEANTGKYPDNSDVLWSDPPGADDYMSQPRAYYTFSKGTGRIIDATYDVEGHIPANPWTGIKWDNTSDSWVKQ
jgi:competence protein ComGC